MNIKEHIEAGHYEPFSPYIGAAVPTRNCTAAQIFTTKCGGLNPIVGVVSVADRGWRPRMWSADGIDADGNPGFDLLPPPPRKVKVKVRIVRDAGGLRVTWANTAAHELPIHCGIDFEIEREEPWS